MFFNAESFAQVKARALGRDAMLFARIKARVDAVRVPLEEDRDYGAESSEAAFVYRVTGEARYRELAARLLAHSAELYVRRHQQKRAVNWYSFSRINAMAAYDWLFNDLPPEDRARIGLQLLHAARDAQPTRTRRAFTAGPGQRERENWGGATTGFYGTPSLLWFAGLATFREGIDDALAEQCLRRGYDLQMEVLKHRAAAAGEDGGSASATLGYWLGAYPWAEFNFFHTFLSATGRDLSHDWPYVALLPTYIFWNWLPGMREFGAGDAAHRDNVIAAGDLATHLAQIAHFYGPSPLGAWLAERAPRNETSRFSWTRFLLNDPAPAPAADVTARLPLARRFANMGQTFFRSGSGDADTYALFTAGGALTQHRHFDANSFVIFKRGFLALDSGTRPEPGQHLSHYYARTVAHNAILIHMPGEVMPSYWGADPPAPGEEKLPFPNDGGQRSVSGSRVVAFETHPDYAYVAGDATAAYHPEKCKLALRQFVFLAPDHFVIFDRVESTYPRTWLLHTAEEPAIAGASFTAAHEQGRLTCRTLLPENAKLAKIGGPGKQFWSGGRNWPLPKGYASPDTTPLFGQWRVEVAGTGPWFLHVLDAAGRPVNAALVRKDKQVGARAAGWEVLFGTEGPASVQVQKAP